MSFDQFRVVPMQRLTASLWNALIEALNGLDSQTRDEILKRVMYEDLGKLEYDIIPDQTNARDLGSPDKTWKAIYAKSGSFTDSLTVQGKAVLKDGDPISIYDILDTARTKITQAIDASRASNLDVSLSTRASESTLLAIKSKTDNIDVLLSSRASEETLNRVLQALYEFGDLVLHDYTTIPLSANSEWTSTTDSSTKTGKVVGSVYSDVSGTLHVEQSPDGTNWDIVDSFTVAGGSGLKFNVEKVCTYLRVRYVNGSSAQTVFRLYVYRRLRVV